MRHELAGVIASAGFTSGHRVVIGNWRTSPVGPMVDVMWCDPAGRRTLFAPDRGVADFVGALYRFDEVVVAPFAATGNGWAVRVDLADRLVELVAGPGWGTAWRRPPWFTRLVEAPVARLALGVRPYGITAGGVREWYRAERFRPVQCGHGSLRGASLGRLERSFEPVHFGFSEPPRRPSLVELQTLIEDPRGRVDRVMAAAAMARPGHAMAARPGAAASLG